MFGASAATPRSVQYLAREQRGALEHRQATVSNQPASVLPAARGPDCLVPAVAAGSQATARHALAERISALGLEKNIADLDRDGFTVLEGVVPPELNARIRARVLEVTADQLGKKRRSGLKFAQLGSLLYHGQEFEEAAQIPEQMAVAEYLVGASYGSVT